MEITIKLKDDEARRLQYFLRIRYKTKAELPKLCRTAIYEVVGVEAKKQLEEND